MKPLLGGQLPRLGFTQLEEPQPIQLLPELLFHPNEFQHKDTGLIQDLIRRVPLAWSGTLPCGDRAGLDVTVMDVSISRIRG